jgi:threonine aldolase
MKSVCKIQNLQLLMGSYLFYNAFFNNTLKIWNKNESGLMMKADSNWNKIIN